MVTKKNKPKPSLQRLLSAQEEIRTRIAKERLRPCPDQVLVQQLSEDLRQLEAMLVHLGMRAGIQVSQQYVFNMTDFVLELLREFLQEELNTMLRGGKNKKSRVYVNCQNELNVVLAEQTKRAEQASSQSSEVAIANAA